VQLAAAHEILAQLTAGVLVMQELKDYPITEVGAADASVPASCQGRVAEPVNTI